MDKLRHAFQIGTKLAAAEFLPKLSRRNKMLALAGTGGGLAALALGLPKVEVKALASGLVDDLVGAATKAGLVEDVTGAVTKDALEYGTLRAAHIKGLVDDVARITPKAGLVHDVVGAVPKAGLVHDVVGAAPKPPTLTEYSAKLLESIESQLTQVYKYNRDSTNSGYYPLIQDEIAKIIKGPGEGHIPTWDGLNSQDLLRKMYPDSYAKIHDAAWERASGAYETASDRAISELEGLRSKLLAASRDAREVPDIINQSNWRRGIIETNKQRQIRAVAENIIKELQLKK